MIGEAPKKMFDEFCTESYSLDYFEEYYFFEVSFDITKNPSDPNSLIFKSANEDFFSEKTPELNFDLAIIKTMSAEIFEVLKKFPNIKEGEALSAFAFATSMVFDLIVGRGKVTQKQVFDN